jgi:hypothetical protein
MGAFFKHKLIFDDCWTWDTLGIASQDYEVWINGQVPLNWVGGEHLLKESYGNHDRISFVPHWLSLLDDKWICDRRGVVLTSSHLQRHCPMLCHARGIVHLLWITESMENCESRSNSRGNFQTRKGIFDIQVINVSW